MKHSTIFRRRITKIKGTYKTTALNHTPEMDDVFLPSVLSIDLVLFTLPSVIEVLWIKNYFEIVYESVRVMV
jgi:hypothetical protein